MKQNFNLSIIEWLDAAFSFRKKLPLKNPSWQITTGIITKITSQFIKLVFNFKLDEKLKEIDGFLVPRKVVFKITQINIKNKKEKISTFSLPIIKENFLNKIVFVYWNDSVEFRKGEKINKLPKHIYIGKVIKQNDYGIFLEKPKEYIFSRNYFKLKNLKYNYFFLPYGMIIKIAEIKDKKKIKKLVKV
jgi:hypothetical protein